MKVGLRPTAAYVNIAAIERNAARMRRELAPGVRLCAVVKADGYGHGAVESARAALAGGAGWLAVACAEEALELRAAGLRDVPVLVMGALGERERAQALAAGADVVVWHEREVQAVAAAGGGRVHVKLDTGMGRLGTREEAQASRVAEAARRTPGVALAGVMTHFATADEREDGGFFDEQLQRFSRWAGALKAASPEELIVHAANSAATLRSRAAHFDMVRCGIAVYGMDPFGVDPRDVGLEPALELRARVAEVKLCRAGQSVGYGRTFVAERDVQVAVLPIGYGDGFRRGLSGRGHALIGGRRLPLVGTISMDNTTVALTGRDRSGRGGEAGGEDRSGRGGEGGGGESGGGCRGRAAGQLDSEAVLIGAQAAERITAEEIARVLGTINYEVTCGLTARVPRVHHRDGRPDAGSQRIDGR